MKRIPILVILTLITFSAGAQKTLKQEWQTIWDEEGVPAYTLPDPLLCLDGTKVTTLREWEKKRRPELMNILRTYMYGHRPKIGKALPARVDEVDANYLNGKVTRKVLTVPLTADKNGPIMHARVYLPNGAEERVPVFLMMAWGDEADQKALSRLIDAGYGMAVFRYTESAPDNVEAYEKGLIPYFYKKGQTLPMPDDWATIDVWAYAASRVMDYLEKDKAVRSDQVAVLGHSRLGKAALWAGASDERFAITFPVNSGCGGTAISRRVLGETLFNANVAFPHWFCGNFQQFSLRERYMPFDQHEVVALCAPRAVYIASGETDTWADPKGEFLGGKGAEAVYALYGKKGIADERGAVSSMPALDHACMQGQIAYHIRTGGHAVLDYDWERFIEYANLIFNRK